MCVNNSYNIIQFNFIINNFLKLETNFSILMEI